ncbi:hypothetical protein BSKO_11249 [Bryopsis sp. KO-2023]|nr:hypothetical protein BSKO_11249 [Bryopsis sp. KO-2023]
MSTICMRTIFSAVLVIACWSQTQGSGIPQAPPAPGKDCPKPTPMCLIFPCDPRFAKCTAVPDAECRVDCGCGFFFVDSQGAVLKCEDPDLDPVCSLPPDMGPCEAFGKQWFYNINTEQCETFIYGGCEGNGNRFSTQKQCQNSRCGSPGGVSDPDPNLPPPATSDVCGLPKDEGSCTDFALRFHYNSSRKRCEPFKFKGCGGNANNFQTPKECSTKCEGGSRKGKL